MGFLNKLSHLVEGSGVGVDIQMMGADPGAMQNLQVMLHAKKEPKIVTNIQLSIVHQETVETQNMEFNTSDQMMQPDESQQTQEQTIYSQDYPLRVELAVGQPIAVPLSAPITQVLSNPGSMNVMWNPGWEISGGFYLHARATVDGSHLHPQAVQLLRQDATTGFWM